MRRPFCFVSVTCWLTLVLSPLLAQSEVVPPPVCATTSNPDECEEPSAIIDDQPSADCGLWLAESLARPGQLGLFVGAHGAPANQRLTYSGDLMLHLQDTNQNEWSPWQDFAWNAADVQPAGLILEHRFLSDVIVGGVGSLLRCNEDPSYRANVVAEPREEEDDLVVSGVHRSTHATAGSFTEHVNYGYAALNPLKPGEELFLSCETDEDEFYPAPRPRSAAIQGFDTLNRDGVCIDGLAIGPSTLEGVGQGAFAPRAVVKGHVVTTTPVLHFDRSQTDIVRQGKGDRTILRTPRPHGIQYTAEVLGKQLLLNYCFGHADSNVLLYPYAPGVSAINHSREQANVALQWAPNDEANWNDYYRSLNQHQLLDEPGEHRLMLQLVALRDIEEDEEIFLDYGADWVAAWEEHEANYPFGENEEYQSANDYKRQNQPLVLRTQDEQALEPYPSNLRTVCFYKDEYNAAQVLESVEWSIENFDCLRPCTVSKRHEIDDNGETVYSYDATVYNMDSVMQPAHCGDLPKEGFRVTQLPDYAVDILDQPYSKDFHKKQAFRHEIGVPSDFYPQGWMKADPKPYGDFLPTKLKPGQLDLIRWADTGEVVGPNSYRLGLDPRIRQTLLEYCNKTGITEFMHHILAGGNSIEVGQNSYVPIEKNVWYLQRPDSNWASDLQWFSPGDEASHQDYLQALSLAGFDDVLQAIGETLGFKGLAAYHVTFIGSSQGTAGYMHYDMTATGNRTFNVIVPLILANETGPELGIQDWEREDENGEYAEGRYRYEYDVAVLNGDDAYHATSALDYRTSKEFRMAATIYISDVDESNVDKLMLDYTQHYPPFDRDLLLSWAGMHWQRDDTSVKLPTPKSDHILLRTDDKVTATA